MSSINTSETIYIDPNGAVPEESKYTNGTIWEPNAPVEAEAHPLLAKGTIVGDYMIMEPISTKGRESVVYKAVKAAETFALKLYHREITLSEAKMNALMQIQCPYIAKLYDYGVYCDQHYEVYRYYANGTIETIGKVEGERLPRYINQLNEALHSLHSAQGAVGMVHGDLKPSNIFLSDDGESLIVGDFGVSNVKTGDNSHFTRICGTPEFAPPSTGLMDQMKKSPAYDYGALGLVIYYLATGYSYFVGCTAEQIAKGWADGIALPEEMDTRIKMLLGGLLQFDENLRFDYKQVFDWYNGAFVQPVQPKKLYTNTQSQAQASLWFGIFDNQVINVSSVEELVVQMKKHWDQAGIKLRDNNFYIFIDKFYPDGSMSAKIRNFLEYNDLDSAVFKTVYTLSDNAELVYRNKIYGTVPALIQAVSEQDADAQELISKGLFLFYVEAMGYPQDTYQAMQEILLLQHCTEYFRIQTIGYMFASDKSFNGMHSIDELRTAVCNMPLEEIDALVSDERFLAWLYVMGMPELSISLASKGEPA